MYVFVPPVLLGMPWLDALRDDSELEPPDRERTEAQQSARGERAAVVAADHVRHPVRCENLLEDSPCTSPVDTLKALAREKVAAEVVCDGQRVAVLLVAHPELALVVHTPNVVRF